MPLWVPKGMGLTPEEEQVKRYLKRYATDDKDGKLRWNELKVALKDLGLHFSGFRAKRAVHYADVNGDGCVDEEEMNDLVKYTVKWRLSNSKCFLLSVELISEILSNIFVSCIFCFNWYTMLLFSIYIYRGCLCFCKSTCILLI